MMAFSERRPGSEAEDDTDDGQNGRPFLPRRAPRLAESYHVPEEPHRRIPLFEVEKHDEDDDDDDDESVASAHAAHTAVHEVERTHVAEHTDFPVYELPLDGPHHELVAPQPIPLEAPAMVPVEAVRDEEEDDTDDANEHPPAWQADGRTPGALFRPRSERPASADAEAAAVPSSLTPEAVVLAAAEERVEAEDTAPAPVAPPTPPQNHNTLPPNPNVVPPLPPQNPNIVPPPPNTPPSPYNPNAVPPPPPPPHNPNVNGMPPNGNGGNYYQINHYNVAPTVVTQVERIHTVETRTRGNLLALVAVVALLRERSRRRRADAELDKNVKKYQSRLETEAKRQAQQEEALKRQGTKLEQADQRIDTLETQMAEHQRAEKTAATLAADEAVRAAAAERFRAQRPAPENRAAVPVAERGTAADGEAEEQAQDPFAQQEPEQSIRYNAWLGTRMRKEAGREVVDTTVDYGHAYHQERRAETAATASRDNLASGSAGAAYSLATPSAQQPLGVPLPGAFDPSLPAGMTNPALPPDGRPPYSEPQFLLPERTRRVRSAASTILIWIVVAALAFAAASAVRLLF